MDKWARDMFPVANRLFSHRMLRASSAILSVASARKGNTWLVMRLRGGELGRFPGQRQRTGRACRD